MAGPDISEIDCSELEARAFPVARSYRICIAPPVHGAVAAHVAEDTAIELAGVLLGQLYHDAEGPYVHVTDSIRAEHTVAQGTQVTFTHATWEAIHRELERRATRERIVGWYHSHPSFGIFLSSMDRFIQENFFSSPWQIAYVVDPVRGQDGFFVWSGGVPHRVPRYWVGNAERAADTSHLENAVTDLQSRLARFARKESSRGAPLWIAVAALVLAVLGGGGALVAARSQGTSTAAAIGEQIATLRQLSQEQAGLAGRVAALGDRQSELLSAQERASRVQQDLGTALAKLGGTVTRIEEAQKRELRSLAEELQAGLRVQDERSRTRARSFERGLADLRAAGRTFEATTAADVKRLRTELEAAVKQVETLEAKRARDEGGGFLGLFGWDG